VERRVEFAAAAGIDTLDHHRDRLRHDHDAARQLAAGLIQLGRFRSVEHATNMVFVDLGLTDHREMNSGD